MRYIYLRVQSGDTLFDLASAHGTTVETLRAANSLPAGMSDLRPGQMLKIPLAGAPAAAGHGCGTPVEAEAVTPAKRPMLVLPLWLALPSGVVTCGAPDQRVIALTFEASFGQGSTVAVLEEMRRGGAQATWFLAGVWAERFPQHARAIAAAGHQVETHAYSHPHLRELNATEMRTELERGIAAVARAARRRPRWLRPPYGAYNRTLLQVAAKLGLGVVLWTFDSLDWQNPGVTFVADRMASLAQPGAIVHMHASADQAPAALRLAIPRLRTMGYGFCNLDDAVRPAASAK